MDDNSIAYAGELPAPPVRDETMMRLITKDEPGGLKDNSGEVSPKVIQSPD